MPAGEPELRTHALYGFERGALLFDLIPHMHNRGAWVKYEALYPDGRRETLLSVPRYDFGWQRVYRLAQPKHLPAGTWVLITAGYDNSALNPANPNPRLPARWGEQTWDEMFVPAARRRARSMRRGARRAWWLALALASACASARAASYRVAPGGDDTAPGTAAQPWKTLQHAADRARGGDLVTIEPGAYVGFSLACPPQTEVAPPAWITFSAEPGVVIDARNARTSDGIDLEGCSYVVIEGFEVAGVPGAGIRVASNGVNVSGVTLRGNDCHDDGAQGIFTSHVDSLLIESNRAARSGQDGIRVSGACVTPTVRGNELAGNAGAGVRLDGDASQGGVGIITGALVEKNIIHDDGALGGAGIDCDGVEAARLRNNLVYAEHGGGISLHRVDASVPATANVVAGNTVSVAADGLWALSVKDGSTGNQVFDNILLALDVGHGSVDVDAASLADFTSDFNVVVDRFAPDAGDVVTLSAWRAATKQDLHSLLVTPAELFVDAAGGDYHLAPASPAIGAGTTQGAPADNLDGRSRADGVDIGAYEHCEGCAADAGADGQGEGDRGAAGDGGTGDAAPDGQVARDGAATDAAMASGASAGCGCAAAPRGAGGAALTLMLVAAALARVRRRA